MITPKNNNAYFAYDYQNVFLYIFDFLHSTDSIVGINVSNWNHCVDLLISITTLNSGDALRVSVAEGEGEVR